MNTTFLIKVKSTSTGCISDATSVSIGGLPANPAPPVATISKVPTCTSPFANITVTSPSSGHNYSFDNGNSYQASRVKNNVEPGTYILKVKNNTTGCISEATPISVDSATCIDLLSQSAMYQKSRTGNLFSNQEKENISMHIYPNPARDYFNIDLNFASFNKEKGSLRIINNLGQIVKQMSVEINPVLKIDIKDFSSGLYQVQCYIKGELVSAKQLLVR